MNIVKLESKVKPFFWVDHNDGSFAVCLTVGTYKTEIFESRKNEGFEGNGYDWTSLAIVFLNEKKPELKNIIDFDPEGSMFCAFSDDKESLKSFAISFKAACEDDSLIKDLFSRAILDS
ncbi:MULTISPECIES: immunity 51 family protein [unclassified Lacinutrix]